ncbi:MAG: IscS subfamily cysteine desulfurase [Planctomycetes bacterium]|nr:IscS subfamily cysteine desulfurase [Planctomycetota bacterium]MCB9910815.1 IscS subfamily cysteine desulfurase [Planctomycetota bacterium]MCB9912253.1 IscS subfamily cysteine desulfurase [Planctomycetota bacterium]HPF12790.1 IscS subfamily cysteine desulfurase [Planctomycetota bacterium]HRV80443.1 IscS subfamily cysteine desulfurase [Planctomycetota bacterium]
MKNKPIYLDYQATTPCDPRVFAIMAPYFTEVFGNAASRSHAYGWEAEDAVSKARAQVANALGATEKEIIFTSGSTEAINLALKGVVDMYGKKDAACPGHIVTSLAEHKAVLDTCKHLETQGVEVTYLKPDRTGRHSAAQVAEALRDDTLLVAIMWVNNEVGSINPIEDIGKLCKERGVLFFSDATQAVGKIPIDVEAAGVDLLCLSGHKVYGPKGVGALYVRRRKPRVRLVAQMDGGGHERGMRSGTLNVPAIVGLGAACELAVQELDKDRAHSRALRDRFEKIIFENLDHVHINGDPEHRVDLCSNLSFSYVEGESLIMGISGLAVSSGSACTSASLEPSHVLMSMGVGDELAHSSIRFGFGRFATDSDVDEAAKETIAAVKKLRELSPLYEMVQEGIDLSTVTWTAH